VKRSILSKGSSLSLRIYMCYSREMALNVLLDNTQECKAMREKAEEMPSSGIQRRVVCILADVSGECYLCENFKSYTAEETNSTEA
jgi:hypothetical protein